MKRMIAIRQEKNVQLKTACWDRKYIQLEKLICGKVTVGWKYNLLADNVTRLIELVLIDICSDKVDFRRKLS